MIALGNDEREILITQTDEERKQGEWHAYSSSPYWTRRLDKIAESYDEDNFGGKHYTLTQKQVLLRQTPKKRVMSDEQRNALAERLRSSRTQ